MRFFPAHIDQVLYKGPLSDTHDMGHERAGRDGQDGTVHDELPFSRIKLHRGNLDMAMEAGFLEVSSSKSDTSLMHPSLFAYRIMRLMQCNIW